MNSTNQSVVVDGKFNNLSVINEALKLENMHITLPIMLSAGTYPLVRNTSTQTRVLVFTFMSQMSFATTAGTMVLNTPYGTSGLPLGLASAASVPPNNLIPRKQGISIFSVLGDLTDGFILWEPNEILSVTVTGNPTGFVGYLNVWYCNFA